MAVTASYAVVWCWNGDDRQATGRLELGPDAIELQGTADGEAVREEISYDELRSVAIGRRDERIGGRQTLVIERASGNAVRVASVAQSWTVSELAERLASLHLDRSVGL